METDDELHDRLLQYRRLATRHEGNATVARSAASEHLRRAQQEQTLADEALHAANGIARTLAGLPPLQPVGPAAGRR